MADDNTKLPKVEDINIDDAEDGPDEVVTGEDGNPVKLTVRSPYLILRSGTLTD